MHLDEASGCGVTIGPCLKLAALPVSAGSESRKRHSCSLQYRKQGHSVVALPVVGQLACITCINTRLDLPSNAYLA